MTALVVALMIAASAGSAIALTVHNYENDPDLAEALRFDAENNHADPNVSSQGQAEKYYLAYLQRATDPDQRARVYVQLGVLFATNYDSKRGEKADFDKSKRYFSQALECAPERVGLPILWARLGMVNGYSREERLSRLLDVYRWMTSITSKEMKEKWLPSYPGDVPSDADIAVTMDIIAHVQESQEINILDDACRSSDPFRALQQVVDTLPDTDLAKRAAAKRSQLLTSPVLDDSVRNIDKDVSAGRERLAGKAQDTLPTAVSSAPSTRGILPEESPGGPWSRYWLTLSIVVVAVLLTVLFGLNRYLRKRRSPRLPD